MVRLRQLIYDWFELVWKPQLEAVIAELDRQIEQRESDKRQTEADLAAVMKELNELRNRLTPTRMIGAEPPATVRVMRNFRDFKVAAEKRPAG